MVFRATKSGKIGIGWDKDFKEKDGKYLMLKIKGQLYVVLPNKTKDEEHDFDYIVYESNQNPRRYINKKKEDDILDVD